MGKRMAAAVACLACALMASRLAAQGAAAATKGTTAFTCVKGQGTLKGEHCLTSGSNPEYGQVAVAENTPTEFQTTNAKTASGTTASEPDILKVTIAGTPLEMKATNVSGAGVMENKKTASGEHYVSWTNSETYTGVVVLKPEKECLARASKGGTIGEIKSTNLKGRTEGQGD